MRTGKVVVVGAGIGGLVAAIDLARQGVEVMVVERAATPGGKMREQIVGGRPIDAGPTVFTLRRVFDQIFADAGANLSDHVQLRAAGILARHAWSAGERLDLFADTARSAEAIATLAGPAEGRGYLAFCARAQEIFNTLEHSFIRTANPTMLSLVGAAGLRDLLRIMPFTSLWKALGEYFHDPRLRQLFGRYATYSGSSPFPAPATLMLIAHVEKDGVWLVEGGMHRLALALEALARRMGAQFRYSEPVAEITSNGRQANGVRLASGERLPADAVVVNADPAAFAAGFFGASVARAIPAPRRSGRSLSALTWAISGVTGGFPLARHNIFFSGNYQAEFDDVFKHARLPREPTVYVCAQDRGDALAEETIGAERLLCLINAPATGDFNPLTEVEIEQCTKRTFGLLARSGLQVQPKDMQVTTPSQFDQAFPATGGALYGQAVHGSMAAFRRPGSRSRIPGLYLAGGGVHPGPGVPMAALSGRMAAAALLADRVSTSLSRQVVTPGGMSMPRAMTGSTR
jgi:1-hydroxycarotenoid 3,4-desaturase